MINEAYIAEKLRLALEAAHESFRAVKKSMPEAPGARADEDVPASPQEALLGSLFVTYKNCLQAFLHIYPRPDAVTGEKKIDALLDYDRDAFRLWLDGVEKRPSK